MIFKKTIRILKIYQEWLLAQSDQNFSELYDKFLGGQCEMDITAVSLLLVPNVHDKKQEIERIDHLLNQIGTSYLLNDVQSNAVGFAMNNAIYPANRAGLEKIYQNSQSENNIEYNHKLQNFLSVHSEPYPDADTLVIFFTNTK